MEISARHHSAWGWLFGMRCSGAHYHISSHYSDVIIGAMASQITTVSIVYSPVCSGTDQRNHQSSASLAFVGGIHRGPVNSPHKSPVTRKIFPFDDVIMSSQYWISVLHHIVSSFLFIWNIFSLDYHHVLPHHKRGIRPLQLRWMVISPNKIDRIKRSTSTDNSVNCALLSIPSVFTTSLADQWIKRQLVVTNSKGDHLSPIRPCYNFTRNVYAHMYRSQEVRTWHNINLAGRL